jgi:hypothetical protein
VSDAQPHRARDGYAYARSGWSDAGDDWSPATSVRSASAPQHVPTGAPLPAHLDPRPWAKVRERERRRQGTKEPERGLPGWAALLVLLVIAGIGGVIDTVSGTQVRGGFNIGIVVASIVAILVVRRSAMFPIVIAPPIVYSAASAAIIYIRSGGLDNRSVIYDAAANWLVYGFPAIAGATAAVLIIAGVRLITRR